MAMQVLFLIIMRKKWTYAYYFRIYPSNKLVKWSMFHGREVANYDIMRK